MDPPIVITGGSIHIDLPRELVLEPVDVSGELVCTNRRIRSVQITGGGLDAYEATPPDGDITITIFYEAVE